VLPLAQSIEAVLQIKCWTFQSLPQFGRSWCSLWLSNGDGGTSIKFPLTVLPGFLGFQVDGNLLLECEVDCVPLSFILGSCGWFESNFDNCDKVWNTALNTSWIPYISRSVLRRTELTMIDQAEVQIEMFSIVFVTQL
jgi:hypothetical protein